MKRSLLVLSLVSLALAGVANAEVKKGDVMLDFLAGWTLQHPAGVGADDINIFFGAARLGVAVTDNIRIAPVGIVAHVENTFDATVWAVGGSAEYVFLPSNTVNPYIGGMVAWASTDSDLSIGGDVEGWLLAPRAGILWTMNRANNLFIEYQFQYWTGSIRDNVLETGHMVLLGIEHKFRVGQ